MAPSHIPSRDPNPAVSCPALTEQWPCSGQGLGVSGLVAGLAPTDFVSRASGPTAEQCGSHTSFLACFRLFSSF